MSNSSSKTIFVSGHEGMVGSAILRQFHLKGNQEILVAKKTDLNLLVQSEVEYFFKNNSIDEIYIASAKVGGIYANDKYPAEFIYQNILMQSNIIHAAHQHNIEKLLFLGSSCIYPVDCSQPIIEQDLLSGPLEPTNQPYAIAKIAGIEMCKSYNRQFFRDYRCVMPTNLYGPNDNFHPLNSHVVPSLIDRFHHAATSNLSEVSVWGSGKPIREFMHVDEMAKACIHLMELEKHEYELCLESTNGSFHVNIGTGLGITIKDLALQISEIVGFKGKIIFDENKPDGAPIKILDINILQESGFKSNLSLQDGLKNTYDWYLKNINNLRK